MLVEVLHVMKIIKGEMHNIVPINQQNGRRLVFVLPTSHQKKGLSDKYGFAGQWSFLSYGQRQCETCDISKNNQKNSS
ncbi:hypothetical protein HNY73_019695 [Argiope bruennichi]|uniref:Uncharacterized protein n=1 Tax=Argiope bruennichi TaxID=94029 RepID=A0A8T0E854_ARGBR|nr:hypothetical protein HNY73_019695 [Argiope bruennichi]